jgi:aspartate aminotransferase-like enzyme
MLLMTPGPTPVPEDIRYQMATPSIHHRTKEFELIFKQTKELLIELFNMKDVLMLSSSGTGAMESAITNFSRKKVLTINSGKFGERFSKICSAFDIDYVELKYSWDTPANLQDILDEIKNDSSIETIAIQICESSGGIRHPIEQISKEVKKVNPNIVVIADGITAIGVEYIDTSNIDVLICGSQKSFMLPPGLSMVGISQFAISQLETNQKGYYFNLYSEYKKQQQFTTAYTATTTLIIGLLGVLKKMKVVGFEKLYKKTELRARSTREALVDIGFKIYPKVSANSMTTIIDENNANSIRAILKEKFNVNIAGGQDHLKGKIFRINHMGFVEDYEACWAINALELSLDALGIRSFDGSANKKFMRNLL